MTPLQGVDFSKNFLEVTSNRKIHDEEQSRGGLSQPKRLSHEQLDEADIAAIEIGKKSARCRLGQL
jgi:hypothetical protein